MGSGLRWRDERAGGRDVAREEGKKRPEGTPEAGVLLQRSAEHLDDDGVREAQELVHRVAQLSKTQLPVVLQQSAQPLRLHHVVARAAHAHSNSRYVHLLLKLHLILIYWNGHLVISPRAYDVPKSILFRRWLIVIIQITRYWFNYHMNKI